MIKNMINYFLLFLPFLFGIWLVLKPSGFQGFLSFQFELMRKLKMVPDAFNSNVPLSYIRVFGYIWIAIGVWIIIMFLAAPPE